MSSPQEKSEANQNLDIILSYASSEQKRSLIKWMHKAAAELVEDWETNSSSREGISRGKWLLWQRLAAKNWDAMASKHHDMDEATYYQLLKAKRNHRSKLRLICSNGEVVG